MLAGDGDMPVLGLRLPYKKTVTDALHSAAGDGLEIGNDGECESEVNY